MQQAFNEINTALMPETVHLATVSQEVFTAQMLTGSEKRPLRVLSLGMSDNTKACLSEMYGRSTKIVQMVVEFVEWQPSSCWMK